MFSKRTYRRRNKPKQSSWLESNDQGKEPSFIPPIQTKLNIGKPGDVYENEADKAADEVVNNNAEQANVQKMGEEKEEVQTKGLAGNITPFVQKMGEEKEEEVQSKEEEEVQAKCNNCAVEEEVQKFEEEPMQAKEEEEAVTQSKEEEEAMQTKEEEEAVAQVKEEEETAQTKEEEEAVAQSKEEEETAQTKEEEEESAQTKEEEETAQSKEEEEAVAQSKEEEEAVQSKEEEEAVAQTKEEEETAQAKEEEKEVQQKSGGKSNASKSIESRLSSHRGGGDKMDDQTKGEMENSFANDFSNVRIHTGGYAQDMNKELKARAFTNGSDIYFNSGQYDPQSQKGKRLLAHELTHTIQQKGAKDKTVQAEFAVAPTTPDRNIIALRPSQIQAAIRFNQRWHTNATEISLMRDILGISATPAVIDESFVNAVARYQAKYGLTMDGRLEHATVNRLAREVQAEGDFLGPGNQGNLAPEFQVQANLQNLVTANNQSYPDYKAVIQAGTMLQRHIALNTRQLMLDMKTKLTWISWGKSIELLGRHIPDGIEMRDNPTVRAAMRGAWLDSDPALTRWTRAIPGHNLAPQCDPVAGQAPTTAHEEGGFVFLNLLTGFLEARRVPRGSQASLPINNPPVVTNSIVVGAFHTHPNVGNCWLQPRFGTADTRWTARNGVPLLMIGAYPGINDISYHTTGIARVHIGGSRGVPGGAGGIAP